MVVIGTALQNRLIDAARRALGPDAETLVREAAPRALGVSLEQVTYAQLPQLLAEVERDAPRTMGRQAAQSMAEELDRLIGHIVETRRVVGSPEAAGRRLDFLMQEFNREANTLSSKSQDLATTRIAVDMKVLIEQMREQVQNIE